MSLNKLYENVSFALWFVVGIAGGLGISQQWEHSLITWVWIAIATGFALLFTKVVLMIALRKRGY